MKNNPLLFFFLLLCITANAARVDTVMIKSKSLGEVKTIIISPQKGETKCPVLYLLHGYSDNSTSWIKSKPELCQIADEKRWIIVCPDGRKSWYWNSPINKDSQYETFMIQELIAYVDGQYKTITEKTGRAITGLSMGGHGAMWLALRNPQIYGAVGSMSGGMDVRPFPKNWEMEVQLGSQKDHPNVWEKHTIINLVDSLKNKQQAIIFDCGADDFFFQVNNNFHQKLLEKKIDHDYIVRPGAHNWKYWSNALDFQILFFEKYFKTKSVISS